MVYMPHLPHKKPITKAMKLSLHNLFQLDSLSVFSHQCDKWDFIPAGDEIFVPSLSLHLSFTAFSLFALHPHFTLISSPPSCSLWCSFNFPMLVCFLGVFFCVRTGVVTATEPPRTSELQLKPHRWKWAEPDSRERHTVRSFFCGGRIQNATGYFQPQKNQRLLTAISYKEAHAHRKVTYLDKHLIRKVSHTQTNEISANGTSSYEGKKTRAKAFDELVL